MRRRTTVLVVAALSLLCLAAAVGQAVAAGSHKQAPKKVTLTIKGGASKKKNAFGIPDSLRYTPKTLTVRSGGTVTIKSTSKADEGPHTLSVIKASQRPKNAKQVENCTVCGSFAKSHKIDEKSGKIGKPHVNVGKKGFNKAGDSILIPAGKASRKIKVTAKAGKTLTYICIVHPWMQGKIKVK